MNLSKISHQFTKFATIGLISTTINYLVFFVFYKLGVFYAWAHVAGYIMGVVFGYFFNRSWTFSSVIEKKHLEFVLYFLVYICSLIVSVAFLQILVELYGLNPLVANLLSIGMSMVTNFFGCKFFVFNEKRISQFIKISKFFTPTFYTILSIKIITSFLTGSHFITEGFLPFVSFFSKTLTNPYQHFYLTHESLFPYPSGMLGILAGPFIILSRVIPVHFFENLNLQLFILRLPIIFFDVLLYIILCLILPTKEKKILWLYFASPVLFYINYFHGQLDVIPTALLFLSIFFLMRGRNKISFVTLGLGIATKTHLLSAVPFYLIYLFKNHFGIKKITSLLFILIATFFILNPFIFSQGFIQTVLNNPEQQRLFAFNFSFGFNSLIFYLAPSAIIFILYKFSSFKKLNLDALLLSLGLTYIVLIALVPPMQGWFYWSLPFLVFFFIKFSESPTLPLWVLNILVLIYFLSTKDSDIFESLKPLNNLLGQKPNLYFSLLKFGKDPVLFQNIIFTILETMLIASAFWCYNVGLNTIKLFQKKKQRFVIAIAGDSGVGKSTLTNILEQVIGSHNLAKLNGDDVHRWERNDPRWKEITHLNPKGNKIHTDLEHAMTLLRGESVKRLAYDHATGNFIGPTEIKPNKFIIFQGLMPFMLNSMRDIQDLKIFIDAEEKLKLKWKENRDLIERKKNLQEIIQQIQDRKPDAEKFIYPQKDFADWSIKYLYSEQEAFSVQYIFKNSIFLENLVEELSTVNELKINHTYDDLNYQRILLEGSINAEAISRIAYKLFPNIFDLVENQPVFENDLKGLHQLFFINYLNYFYQVKLKHEELS